MGRFSDVVEAKPLTKLPWFPPDFAGTVRILCCKCIKSQDKATEYYIAELEVLTSNLSSVPVSSHRAWTQDRLKRYVGPAAVRLFIAAVLGVDGNSPDITDEVIGASVGDYEAPGSDGRWIPAKGGEGTGFQPFAGRMVDLVTNSILTKAKTQFTKHTFAQATMAA